MDEKRDIPFKGIRIETKDGVTPISKELVDAVMKMYGPRRGDADGDISGSGSRRTFDERVTKNRDRILAWINEGKTKRFIHVELGVSRTTLERFIRSDDELMEAWKDALEDKLDWHEENVCDIAAVDSSMDMTENGAFPRNDGRIMAASLNASKLWLEHMGRSRGWTPKIETCETGAGGRIPIILCGAMSEESIAEAEAQIKEQNDDIEAKLLNMGINKG